MTSDIETTETLTPEAQEPKAPKKANVGARRANVAPKKAKSAKKASPAKKAAKGAKKAKGDKQPKRARYNSKTAIILDLLKRPGGATANELKEATGWQPHSVRGFISGTVGKKMGLAVISTRGDDGGRSYSIKS
jgi:hypothetical protein